MPQTLQSGLAGHVRGGGIGSGVAVAYVHWHGTPYYPFRTEESHPALARLRPPRPPLLGPRGSADKTRC